MNERVKERGILFTPENYDKTESGVKTQTRRIITWPDWVSDADKLTLALQRPAYGLAYLRNGRPDKIFRCPFGVVGDRLYCKESHYRWGRWMPNGHTKNGRPKWRFQCHPKKKTLLRLSGHPKRWEIKIRNKGVWGWQKRSPLFMPKSDARLWLEIIDVRAEWLQDISPDYARAEGCDDEMCAKGAFADLWESIHGKGSWDINPWVWVLSYKKVDRTREDSVAHNRGRAGDENGIFDDRGAGSCRSGGLYQRGEEAGRHIRRAAAGREPVGVRHESIGDEDREL